ncbi:hypothetical protein [Methanoculleus oceani]|uniref:PGF-CTERM sorting domain-containing protein n=1 Tax=Methanoculleus oceani TaxID=2184756 RepID=A0ABD4TC83_9EURY|nr:hypothetical protein [Methanoculleus sp. CWC-02]MCM2465054.1 hypothetical protein [Methanoculleus sp. CWC-02]
MNVRRLAGIAVALVLTAWICGTAAAQETAINEIGMVAANETLTISGTTNLAPGNHLLVEVTPVGFEPTNKSAPGGTGGTSGTAVVEEGNATANTWSFTVDTSGFEPGVYTVTVEWVEGDATASTTFTVVEAATATPTVTTPAATATTPPATAPGPTPTAAGPVLPAAALAAGLAGYLVRRR